jgi:flagellar hook-basal body complex protein FliE
VRVEPLIPDAPAATVDAGDGAGFARTLDALANALAAATRAEDDFAYGRGTLHDAVYERARADVALSVATATAQRIAQAAQSVLNMQV